MPNANVIKVEKMLKKRTGYLKATGWGGGDLHSQSTK